MQGKSDANLQNALSLKNRYFSSNRSREVFNQLEEAAKDNYWARRLLADIYRDGKNPWFASFYSFLHSHKLIAFDLYLDLTYASKEERYSNTYGYQDYIDLCKLSKEDLYAQFNASRLDRDFGYMCFPTWALTDSGKEPEEGQWYYEERVLFAAFCLALSQDVDAKQGLSYLQTTSKPSSSNVAKNVKVLLALALRDQPLLQLLKRQSPKEFKEVIDTILRVERLGPIIKIANANNDQQILELIKEQNPGSYEDSITAMLKDEKLAPTVQKHVASKLRPNHQPKEINSEETSPSLYPKLEHHPQPIFERKTTEDFFKDFSATMQLLRRNDEHDMPAAANPFKQEPQIIESKTVDDKDLIEFIELSFPEAPTNEPTASQVRKPAVKLLDCENTFGTYVP